MSNHLTESELIEYLLYGAKSISPAKALHIEGCPDCKNAIADQVAMDNLLRNLEPQKSNSNVFERIESQVKTPAVEKSRDWFFGITVVMLIIVAFSFVFQNKNSKVFTDKKLLTPALKMMDKKIPDLNWKVPLDDGLTNMTTFFEKYIVENPSLRFALGIIFVLLLYLFLDHHILKRRKV